jgi:hypothetical protein
MLARAPRAFARRVVCKIEWRCCGCGPGYQDVLSGETILKQQAHEAEIHNVLYSHHTLASGADLPVRRQRARVGSPTVAKALAFATAGGGHGERRLHTRGMHACIPKARRGKEGCGRWREGPREGEGCLCGCVPVLPVGSGHEGAEGIGVGAYRSTSSSGPYAPTAPCGAAGAGKGLAQ